MSARRYKLFLFLFASLVWLLVLWMVSACNNNGQRHDYGGGMIVIELPFAQGKESLCTQGPNGTYSHQSASTRYDIDFDTHNSVDEALFAPIGGVAWVHTESATSSFGYHINIDLGNGSYVVLAHMKDVFVRDGEEVAQGQLLGYEGCTGHCNGDHVHIGLHEGDAQQTADQGISIPVAYWASNASLRTDPQIVSSEDFVCGIQNQGDAQDGYFYESDLSINLWHPDGMLIKTPDNARVYVLQDGQLHWIQNEQAFLSRGWNFSDVVLVSEKEFSCYGKGSDIIGQGLVDAFKDSNGDVWLVYGSSSDPKRYRQRVRAIGWQEVLFSWGLAYDETSLPNEEGIVAAYLQGWPEQGGFAGLRDGTLVSESNTSAVFFISHNIAMPIESWDVYLLMSLFQQSIQMIDDGLLVYLHQVGNCATDQYCLDRLAVETCGGGMDFTDGIGTGGDNSNDFNTPVPTPTVTSTPEVTVMDVITPSMPQETFEAPTLEPTVTESMLIPTPSSSSTSTNVTDDGDNTGGIFSKRIWLSVVYPTNVPRMTLTVQPIFSEEEIGDYWSQYVTVVNDRSVSWGYASTLTNMLGVRFNVGVDLNGDGLDDEWYCYGHYATAKLDPNVRTTFVVNDTWMNEQDALTWSPGEEDDISLGCSALFWLESSEQLTEGFVQ